MEYIDFKKLIDALVARPKETEWIEFKHNFHSKEEIGERISAIANSAYLCNMPFGYIVYGVDDGTHNIIGTDLYGKQKMVGNEELESWLSTRLNPRIDFEVIDNFDYEDCGHICIFKIPATVNRPVSFLHETYVRIGTTTRKLKDFPSKEAKIWKGGQKSLEKILLKKGLSPQEVLNLLSAETYFDMMNIPLPQDTKGIMERFVSESLIQQDEVGYSITELGALLFAKSLGAFDGLKRKFADIDKNERVRACYQHACLRYVSNEKMNNQSLRARLGIEDKNYPMASRIIKDALEARVIKEENPDGGSRHNYVPYWA